MAKSSSKLGKKLAKAVVKAVKTVTKAAQKKTAKTPVKSVAKAEKDVKSVVAKGAKSSDAKEQKKSPAKAAKLTQDTKAPTKEAKATKPEDKLKKPKKPKAGKASTKTDELDLGDDLVGDDDMGGEDIPDLAEFEEIEIEVEETDDSLLDEKMSDVTSQDSEQEVILTDAEGRRYCRVRDCDQIASVEAYCRFHYLLLWKKIQVRRKILADGKLERYVEELTSRYPDKFLEMIRKDLKTEKDFLSAIAELEIDESAVDNEFEDESASFIEEVRGMSEGASAISDDDEF